MFAFFRLVCRESNPRHCTKVADCGTVECKTRDGATHPHFERGVPKDICFESEIGSHTYKIYFRKTLLHNNNLAGAKRKTIRVHLHRQFKKQ